MRAGFLVLLPFGILWTLFWVKWRAVRGHAQEWRDLASFKKELLWLLVKVNYE